MQQGTITNINWSNANSFFSGYVSDNNIYTYTGELIGVNLKFTEPNYYLKMAKSYLTDGDYFGDPSERAYHNAKKRVEYFKHK